MSAKQLVKRIAAVMLMTVGILLLLAVMRAEATPIRPDVRKVVSEGQQDSNDYIPARAGWNGPEMSRTTQAENATYAQLQSAAHEVRASLIAASIPDYRALAAIALIILLLRRMRKARRKQLAAANSPVRLPVAVEPSARARSVMDVADEDDREERAA